MAECYLTSMEREELLVIFQKVSRGKSHLPKPHFQRLLNLLQLAPNTVPDEGGSVVTLYRMVGEMRKQQLQQQRFTFEEVEELVMGQFPDEPKLVHHLHELLGFRSGKTMDGTEVAELVMELIPDVSKK